MKNVVIILDIENVKFKEELSNFLFFKIR